MDQIMWNGPAMSSCPECGCKWSWHLADGRFKCRRCGKGYSRISVWNFSRLPEAAKRRLLELSVRGDTGPPRGVQRALQRVPWSATRPRLAGAGRATAFGEMPQAKSLCSASSKETARPVSFQFNSDRLRGDPTRQRAHETGEPLIH
jgi:hypothetical protein